MSRGPGRILATAAVGVALAGCATSHSPAAVRSDVPSREPAVTPVSPAAIPRSPSASYASTPALGPLTKPLPAGITSVKVTFRGTGSVYRRTITDSVTVGQIVGDVDDSHQDTGQTQGCAMSPVTMTLEFIGPSSDTVYSEDSGCARASLAFDGSQGPLLDAWLTDTIEQLLHVTFDINGSPSVAPTS